MSFSEPSSPVSSSEFDTQDYFYGYFETAATSVSAPNSPTSPFDILDPDQPILPILFDLSTHMDSNDSSPVDQDCSPPKIEHTSILHEATNMPLVKRFHYLHQHTKLIIQLHGPYNVNESGHLICSSHPRPTLSESRLARSLAAAQDAIETHQPAGPVFEDLRIIHLLWTTTTVLLEKIIDTADLEKETLGWGTYALTSGYLSTNPLFQSHKQRLHAALLSLRTLQGDQDRDAVVVTRTGIANTVVTARRSAHVCSTMILQEMRRDWGLVRWFHALSVCERWVEHLRWDGEEEEAES